MSGGLGSVWQEEKKSDKQQQDSKRSIPAGQSANSVRPLGKLSSTEQANGGRGMYTRRYRILTAPGLEVTSHAHKLALGVSCRLETSGSVH